MLWLYAHNPWRPSLVLLCSCVSRKKFSGRLNLDKIFLLCSPYFFKNHNIPHYDISPEMAIISLLFTKKVRKFPFFIQNSSFFVKNRYFLNISSLKRKLFSKRCKVSTLTPFTIRKYCMKINLLKNSMISIEKAYVYRSIEKT